MSSAASEHLLNESEPEKKEEDFSHTPSRFTRYTTSSIYNPPTSSFWPSPIEDSGPNASSRVVTRSVRRRIFLILSKPSSSTASFLTFIFMMTLVVAANIVMMLETTRSFVYKPEHCSVCDNFSPGNSSDLTDDIPIFDDFDPSNARFCECEPVPKQWLLDVESVFYYVFTSEYLLKLLFFQPTPVEAGGSPQHIWRQFFAFFLNPWQLIDVICLIPFYVSKVVSLNSLTDEYDSSTFDFTALRVLRLTRIFQVVKLGRNSDEFHTFGKVVMKSAPALNLLFLMLVFGACIFASLIYEAERGEWEFTTLTDPPSYQYMRNSKESYLVREISPFNSIPDSFWWFIATATTTGYGDMVPTSTWGEIIGAGCIIFSLLIVAFPISVFTNLWKNEYQSGAPEPDRKEGGNSFRRAGSIGKI